MNWLVDNWYVVFALAALLIVVIYAIIRFANLPSEQQISKAKEWLKLAVTLAEKELGSGTGALKLRYVYDLFVSRFPAIAKVVSFQTYSAWVDDALVWLNTQLTNNPTVKDYVAK